MSGAPMCAPLEITGTRPRPRPNSCSFSRHSLSSGIAVGSSRRKSGRLERTFWISGVASDSGGVKVSSTTSLRPSFSMPPSRMGLAKLTGAAVLSMTMATVLGLLPVAASASLTRAGSALLAWAPPVGEVWNTYLKPRAVI